MNGERCNENGKLRQDGRKRRETKSAQRNRVAERQIDKDTLQNLDNGK